jgi:hypothetical protein
VECLGKDVKEGRLESQGEGGTQWAVSGRVGRG